MKSVFLSLRQSEFQKTAHSAVILNNQICTVVIFGFLKIDFNYFLKINIMITLPVFNFMHFWLQTDSLMRIYSVLLTWESKKGRKIPTVIDSR